jgi:alpha-L-rhamnosidase
MGNLKPAGWDRRWIAWNRKAINSGPLPMFRREFAITRKVSRATVYICGLGFFELYLNGHKVGDHVLDPGWTNYRQSAVYVTCDVHMHVREYVAMGMK